MDIHFEYSSFWCLDGIWKYAVTMVLLLLFRKDDDDDDNDIMDCKSRRVVIADAMDVSECFPVDKRNENSKGHATSRQSKQTYTLL